MHEHTHQPDTPPTDAPANPPASASDAQIGDEVMGILSDVEEKLARLRAAQKTQDVEVASLSDRAEALDAREAGLRDQLAALEQEREALAELEQEITDKQSQLIAQRDQFDRTCTEQREKIDRMKADAQATLQAAETRAAEAEQQLNAAAEQNESLRERQQSIQQRTEELDTREQQLNTSLERLHREQDRVAEIEKVSAAQLAELEQAAAAAEQQRAEMARRAEEADATRQEHEARVAALQQQLDATEQQRQALTRQAEETAAAHESRIASLQDELTAAEQQQVALKQQIEAAAANRQEHDAQLAALQQELNSARETIARTEQDAVDLSTRAEAERDEARQAATEAQQQLTKLTEEVTTLRGQTADHEETRAALEKAAKRVEAAQSEAARLRETLAEREATLKDNRDKLNLAGEKLAAFAEAINEQATQVEKGAAAMVHAEQQARDIERLQAELAKARVNADPDAITQKDERIAQLTEALRQARGQTAGQTDVGALETRIAEQDEALHQLKVDLEAATVKAGEAERALEQHRASTVRDANDSSRHSVELEQAAAEIARLEQAMENTRRESATRTDELRNTISELEARLESGSASSSAEIAQEMDVLKEKARRVAQIATHLKRRKKRLRAIRKTVGQSARSAEASAGARPVNTDALEEHAANMRKLEEKRRELVELRSVLAASERKMVKKWARGKSISNIAWVAIVMVCTAVASWFAADNFLPATMNVTADLEATSPTGSPLSDAELNEWAIWHKSHLMKDGFHSLLATRMDDRGMKQYDSPAEIRERINGNLAVDILEPGEMRIALTGADRAESEMFLDMLITTLARDSQELAGTREGGAIASPVGGTRENKRMHYAQVDPITIADQRLMYAGIIFGAASILIALIAAIFYSTLVKAKRVFDDDEPLIEPEVGLTQMA